MKDKKKDLKWLAIGRIGIKILEMEIGQNLEWRCLNRMEGDVQKEDLEALLSFLEFGRQEGLVNLFIRPDGSGRIEWADMKKSPTAS